MANILLVAGFAGDAVNHIGAFTANVEFAGKHLVCGAANEGAGFVQQGAELTFFVAANPFICGFVCRN